MYQPQVFFSLNLKNIQARKLYKISRIRQCTLVDLVKDIIGEYVEEIKIDGTYSVDAKLKSSSLGNRKIIGEKIAMLRRINCLNQEDLGQSVGLDGCKISAIERGVRGLDIIEAMAIAQVLGVELSEIAGRLEFID